MGLFKESPLDIAAKDECRRRGYPDREVKDVKAGSTSHMLTLCPQGQTFKGYYRASVVSGYQELDLLYPGELVFGPELPPTFVDDHNKGEKLVDSALVTHCARKCTNGCIKKHS